MHFVASGVPHCFAFVVLRLQSVLMAVDAHNKATVFFIPTAVRWAWVQCPTELVHIHLLCKWCMSWLDSSSVVDCLMDEGCRRGQILGGTIWGDVTQKDSVYRHFQYSWVKLWQLLSSGSFRFLDCWLQKKNYYVHCICYCPGYSCTSFRNVIITFWYLNHQIWHWYPPPDPQSYQEMLMAGDGRQSPLKILGFWQQKLQFQGSQLGSLARYWGVLIGAQCLRLKKEVAY